MDGPAQNRTALTARQRKLVEALLTTPNVTAASESVGVARSTAYAWMKLPAFRDELNRAQRAAFDASLSRIASMSCEAVNKLKDLIGSANESIALGAVRLVLEAASSHLDNRELVSRLEEIEARLVGDER